MKTEAQFNYPLRLDAETGERLVSAVQALRDQSGTYVSMADYLRLAIITKLEQDGY